MFEWIELSDANQGRSLKKMMASYCETMSKKRAVDLDCWMLSTIEIDAESDWGMAWKCHCTGASINQRNLFYLSGGNRTGSEVCGPSPPPESRLKWCLNFWRKKKRTQIHEYSSHKITQVDFVFPIINLNKNLMIIPTLVEVLETR